MRNRRLHAGQVVPPVPGHDRGIRVGAWVGFFSCFLLLAACGKAKRSETSGAAEAGQTGSEEPGGGSGTGVGGNAGMGGNSAGGDGAGAGAGNSTGGVGGEAGTTGGSAGAAGAMDPDYPTCEELYDGSQARCGATPAYPSDTCRAVYQQRSVSFDNDALGFSARDLLSAFTTPGVGTLVWFDGQETTIRLTADPEVVFGNADRTFATLNNAPPGEGYCGRDLRLEARDAVFAITSDDGRLEWSLMGTIYGHDQGCGIQEVVFLLSGDREVSVDLPPEWTLPGATEFGFDVQINATVNRCGSCTDADDYCGPSPPGGRFVYYSSVVDENDHLVDSSEHVVGEWTYE